MKKLLLALAFVLAPTLASAACSGVFPNNTACGNISGAPNVPNVIPLSSFPANSPGGTNGQIQYNNSGAFGGFTASGDATINTGTGVVTLNTVATSKGGTGANNSTNSAGDVLASNGANGTFVHTALNVICSTAPSVCAGITGYYNVAWYGAVCNGSTDDTSAINAALTAVPANGRLVFPSGVVCLVKSSNTATLVRTTPITLDCQGSQIINDASVPSTTSMIEFVPAAGTTTRRWWVTNCFFNANGKGLNVIYINPASNNSTNMAEFWIDHVTDAATASAAGYSIYVGNTNTNTNGGLFNTLFTQNNLANGVYLNFAGDSIRITNNILTGNKYGVYANLITGAAGLLITGNNVTAATPLLIDAAVGNLAVNDNEFEQSVTNTDPGGAVVDFRGGTNTLQHVTFTGNSINALSGSGSPNPLKITNAASAFVEANTFTTSASVVCIVNAGGATIIGANNTFAGCSANVSNTGVLHYVQVGTSP